MSYIVLGYNFRAKLAKSLHNMKPNDEKLVVFCSFSLRKAFGKEKFANFASFLRDKRAWNDISA